MARRILLSRRDRTRALGGRPTGGCCRQYRPSPSIESKGSFSTCVHHVVVSAGGQSTSGGFSAHVGRPLAGIRERCILGTAAGVRVRELPDFAPPSLGRGVS